MGEERTNPVDALVLLPLHLALPADQIPFNGRLRA